MATTKQNSTDGEEHFFANDGTDWRSQAGPVDTKKVRKADKALDDKAADGDGPSATNELRLESTTVEGSESPNNNG